MTKVKHVNVIVHTLVSGRETHHICHTIAHTDPASELHNLVAHLGCIMSLSFAIDDLGESSAAVSDLQLACVGRSYSVMALAPSYTTHQRYSSGSTRPRTGARMAVCRGRHIFSSLLSLPCSSRPLHDVQSRERLFWSTCSSLSSQCDVWGNQKYWYDVQRRPKEWL